MALFRSMKNALQAMRQPGGRAITFATPTDAGVTVTEDSAMRLAAVHACVRVLAEDVAALPLHVYRRTEDGGKERDDNHPLYELLHDRPNDEMNAVQLKEALMVNALTTGNGYAFIEFDRRGRVRALYPLLSGEVQPYRTERGEIRYRAGGEDLRQGEVFHLPGMGFDGLVGLSPIAYAMNAIGLGMAAEKYGQTFFKNGSHVGGVVSVEGELSDQAFERLSQQFKAQFKGLQQAHGVPVLEGGAKYTPVGIPPEEAQFLETRKFQRSEIAAIYRVPPHMIGDLERATFSNIEQQDLAYLQRSLLPWLTRWEQEIRAKLIPEEEKRSVLVAYETANFMRGETATRMQAYSTAIMSGVMMPNEARRRENLNPAPGGDVLLLPLNMVAAGSQPDAGAARSMRDFTIDGWRRAVDPNKTAAILKNLAISRKIYSRTAKAFTEWLERQADDVMQIVDEETGGARSIELRKASETAPERIRSRLASYYRRLQDPKDEAGLEASIESGEFPGWKDANAALEDIAGQAFERIGNELGESGKPDDEWKKGYLKRYRDRMTTRLCQANFDQLADAIRRAGESDEDLHEMMATTLQSWRRMEYDTAARGENMARTEIAMMKNEALIAGYRRAGYSSIWSSMAGCCAICERMNGQRVTALKPPLHKGCGCGVVMGPAIEADT